VVHAAPAASRDEMTMGGAVALAKGRDMLRASSSGDEAVAFQPDSAFPVAELTDRTRNTAGTGAWVAGIS